MFFFCDSNYLARGEGNTWALSPYMWSVIAVLDDLRRRWLFTILFHDVFTASSLRLPYKRCPSLHDHALPSPGGLSFNTGRDVEVGKCPCTWQSSSAVFSEPRTSTIDGFSRHCMQSFYGRPVLSLRLPLVSSLSSSRQLPISFVRVIRFHRASGYRAQFNPRDGSTTDPLSLSPTHPTNDDACSTSAVDGSQVARI